jgi:hypothetical protein
MATRETIRPMLAGGDRRSIGRANEVVDLVRREPKRVDVLCNCLWDTDACVRMRAADALEKLSREKAEFLQPYRKQLLRLLGETDQREVRWHLAMIIPRLRLTVAQCQRATDLLLLYLEDKSSIVKTCAMEGLAQLAAQHKGLRPMVLNLLRASVVRGTPAMRARGRILLQRAAASLTAGDT